MKKKCRTIFSERTLIDREPYGSHREVTRTSLIASCVTTSLEVRPVPSVSTRRPGTRRIARAPHLANAAHERRPLIIYASRTHSQLAQVIRELKSTKYRPRMAVIGSRQQMCVHKDVRTLTGAAQNAACRARTASRSCAHHNELESFQMREPDFGR